MQVYDKKKRARLIKESTSYLRSKGWLLKHVHRNSFDFSATKDGLSFLVECVDASVLNYKNFPDILQYLEGQATSFASFGVPAVAVMDSEFDPHDFSYIAAHGVLAVTLSNIEGLDALSRLAHKIPVDLLPFQHLFARKSFALATSLSQNCKTAGELEEAIAWGEIAVAAAPQALGAVHRLIGLLSARGDIDRASVVCREALRRNPTATNLINIMRDIAKESSNEKEIAYWNNSRNDRVKTGSAAEFLLGRRPISAARLDTHASSSQKSSEAPGNSRKGFFSFFEKGEGE